MPASARIIYSDENLVHHGQPWPGVPIILVDGLLACEPSEWILDLRIRGCSPDTLISYAKSMAIWLRALSDNGMVWSMANRAAAERFHATLLRENSAESTARLRMTHVQEFYRWACARRYIASLPFELQRSRAAKRAAAHQIKLPRAANRQVKPQTQADFDRVLEMSARKSSALTLRDELIAEAGRFLGLRCSEIPALRVDQFASLDLSKDVHSIEIVSAKGGGRVDSVLVPRLFAKKVQDFIAIEREEMLATFRRLDPAYVPPPNVFLTERGKRRGRPLTAEYVSDSWRRSSVSAGLDTRFHDNRSSFGTNAASAARLAGVDARVVVKELLRHRNASTSEIYVRFDEIESDRLLRAKIVNDAYYADQKSKDGP